MSITIKARIESYEVQPNDIVRPSTLFRLFQKASGDDLDQIGLTYDFLRDIHMILLKSQLVQGVAKEFHLSGILMCLFQANVLHTLPLLGFFLI